MKPIIISIFAFFVAVSVNAQSYNSCTDAFNAPTITAGTYSVGTIDGDEPSDFCITGSSNSSVTAAEWVKYVPTADYSITVSSDLPVNGNKDTRLHIYTGTCGSLTCVGGDDDSGTFTGTNTGSYLSVLTVEVTANQTYYIVWDNKYTDSNDFDFELTENPPTPPVPVTFTTQASGMSGSYKRGMVDMNGDFLDDLVAVNTDSTYVSGYDIEGDPIYTTVEKPYIFIRYQLAGGTFQKTKIVTSYPDYKPSWSLAAGDWDANGYNDLLYGGNSGVTFMKANSTGTAYTEISGPEYVFSQRSNFVDINNDGHLDAFVCHDTAPSVSYINDGSNNLIYENTNGLGDYASGGNYGSIWVDYDNDRDIDMFMAKCGGSTERRTNQLYRNNGNGTYTEVGTVAGLDDIMQTWSSAWGDFDNDGDMDIYIGSSTANDHKIMRNNNDGTFTDVTAGSGISSANQGIECVAGDFDNDGYLDVLSNGSILFGDGTLKFNVYSGPPSGSIGDINNDGFLDVFTNSVYVNDGNSNNWIKIITIGDQAGGYSNINGIGARVEINSALGTQIRDVQSGTGFRHMSTLNTHFGIGTDSSINYIRIYWPSGIIDQVNNPSINGSITIIEGANTLGLEDSMVNDLILYPNPTKDILNLGRIDNLADAFYTIFDITGKRVVNAKLSQNSIDVSHLNSGNYILRVVYGASIKTQKFIKY